MAFTQQCSGSRPTFPRPPILTATERPILPFSGRAAVTGSYFDLQIKRCSTVRLVPMATCRSPPAISPDSSPDIQKDRKEPARISLTGSKWRKQVCAERLRFGRDHRCCRGTSKCRTLKNDWLLRLSPFWFGVEFDGGLPSGTGWKIDAGFGPAPSCTGAL